MKSLTPGTLLLDRYRVLRPLPPWYGGAALARDERLGQEVDLLLAPYPSGTPLGALFAHRAQLIGALQHAALPVVCDIAAYDGHPLLVRRHVDGRSLSQLLDDGPAALAPTMALHVVADVATALGLAHAHGLCHGALDARSVLVDAQGNAVIGDLVWPYGAGAVPAATPRDDVLALCRLLPLLLDERRAARRLALWLDVEQLLRHATASGSQALFATGAELGQAIEQLITRYDAGLESTAVVGAMALTPAQAVTPRRRPVPARTTQRLPVSGRASASRRPATSPYARRVPARSSGTASPLILALILGTALTLLPGVEALAGQFFTPPAPMEWHLPDRDWGARHHWNWGSFQHQPWVNPFRSGDGFGGTVPGPRQSWP